MNNNQSLLLEITKMKPIEFAGLAKLLGVDIMQPKNQNTLELTTTSNEPQKCEEEPRSFVDVLEDVMKKYNQLNRTRRREILKLVKKANNKKAGDGLNANNS